MAARAAFLLAAVLLLSMLSGCVLLPPLPPPPPLPPLPPGLGAE